MPLAGAKEIDGSVSVNNSLHPAVVLVAERTLSAAYKVLFEGIFATMQTTQVPALVMRRFLARAMPTDSAGRAAAAPLGLRRVESALLARTPLTAADVVCTTPEALEGLLGPWVRVVGVSSSDPLGRGMSNTTTAAFWKGQLYTRVWTSRLMDRIARAKARHGFKVVAGGAGAWQYLSDGQARVSQGIDTVFDGYFETGGPELFMDILAGADAPPEVRGEGTGAEMIEPIAAASMLGVIELSRGCGRGCRFCTMARRRMSHLPAETILADLRTNVAAGIRSVVSGSEDFFRYGATGTGVNFHALAGLLEKMKRLSGVTFMQIDHANVSSVLQFSDAELKEIRRLLTWRERTDYLWVNMGVESANGRLVHAVAPGKIAPFGPDEWEDMVREAAAKMTRCGFFPVFSVILGLPGETGGDLARTLELVRGLGTTGCAVFPIFFEPVAEGERFTLEDMRAEHLELYTACYEINFKQVPGLFWDNQRAGGVSWLRRALMQLLGKMEVRSWRRNFRRVGKQISRRETASVDEASGPVASAVRN